MGRLGNFRTGNQRVEFLSERLNSPVPFSRSLEVWRHPKVFNSEIPLLLVDYEEQ